MEPQFWHERWVRNEIGFHQADFHPLLTELWQTMVSRDMEVSGCVFVPLCGKSRDMVWLRQQGHAVLGVELSPVAIESFFREQQLSFEANPSDDAFQCYESDGFTLLAGDFFDLQAHHLCGVKAVYDRAALIALPESMRRRYVEQLLALLPPGVPMLLVALEYDPAEMSGPPFSVDEQGVHDLFGVAYDIERLAAEEILDASPALKNRGLTRLTEKAYRLSPRNR